MTPPNLRARGKTVSMEDCLPLTELMSGLPLTCRSPIASAFGSDVSICSGQVATLSTARIARSSMAASSIPGTPQFTSRIAAPFAVCFTASRMT